MGRISHQSGYSQADTSGLGNAVSVQHDLAGNITSLTYPDGRVLSQTWDAAGHLIQIADGSGYLYLTPNTRYNPDGSPAAVYYGNGVANGYLPNNRQQIEEMGVVRVGSLAPSSGYAGTNNLSVKEYCYGPATSAISSTIPGCPSLGNNANNGMIWQVIDTLNVQKTQNFGYDNLNRVTQFLQADGNMQQTFAYDSFGNLNQTSPGTLQSNLGFDANNRINSGGYGYDPAGNVTSVFNGISTIPYSYDADGKLISVNGGLASYSYDPEGNRIRKDMSPDWTEYVVFGGQTLAERNDDGTWSDYIYANGQRIVRADNYDVRIHMSGTNCSGCGSTNTFAGTTAFTGAVSGAVIQNGDLLTWRQYQDGVASGGISVAFNNNTVGTSGVLVAADGQLADKDTRVNNWYLREADLSAYAGMTVSSLNLYNYQGGAAGNWDIFLGDISLVHANGTVVPIYHRTMTSLTQFPPGAAESNVSVITDKWFNEPTTLVYPTYYSGDHIGSTRIMTSGGGWPMSSETYYPFGQEQSSTTDPNHYKFTGFERDSESGLDHAMFRQHSSQAGRWMSPDPSGLSFADPSDPQTLNLYSYVRNSPMGYVDPSGLCGYWSTATDVFTNIDGTQTITKTSTYVGDDNCAYNYYDGVSAGIGYFGGGGQSTTAPSNPTAPCTQSSANGKALDYSQPLFNGMTTMQHIQSRHMPGVGKQNVSTYWTQDWSAVGKMNYWTFVMGTQSLDRGSVVFDFTFPNFRGWLTPGSGLQNGIGYDSKGNDTLTNHLVVMPDCKTVVTSYPIG
ncbi:MAG TPA: RHS repeat-associated core domain-containing protein [Edaphobacter sp.]|nr:RHS repeat-associated core domain-containing protein [Edaphobacter sp.]